MESEGVEIIGRKKNEQSECQQCRHKNRGRGRGGGLEGILLPIAKGTIPVIFNLGMVMEASGNGDGKKGRKDN